MRNFFVLLFLLTFSACSDINLGFNKTPEVQDKCANGYCIEIEPMLKGDQNPMLTLKFRSDYTQRANKATLKDIELENLQNSFQFNFSDYVYLVLDSDTLHPNFSHLESDGGVRNELVQIIGFDSLNKKFEGSSVVVNDIFFTKQQHYFEL